MIGVSRCYYLHELSRCVTMRLTLKGVKGGHFDCYGLSYSRGGSDRTEALRGYDQTNAPLSCHARVQTWARVAHRQNRVRRVETSETQSISTISRGQIRLVSVAEPTLTA